MDQVQDHKLTLYQLLLDFPSTPPDHDSEESTSSVGHSCELHFQHNPNETEWGAILRRLEESLPVMSAAEMIDDHQLRPSSASHSPADTPLLMGANPPMMSSFGNCSMNPSQHHQFNADSQLQALETEGADSAARIDEKHTSPSTPNNTKHRLEYLLDELLMSQDVSYINDHTHVAQPSEDPRHQQYDQNQVQLFNGTNTTFPHLQCSGAHLSTNLNQHHHNNILQTSNSANYSNMSHAESGTCTPATSASSIKEPLDMEDSNLDQPELNTTNSIDKPSSFTNMITEDHNPQEAQPGDELVEKKRGNEGNLRLKKAKRQRSSKLAIRMKSEVDIVDDGFRWRKYGQKAVKDSPYARNYYKCTDKGCSVKKHVERQRNEPDVVVTTYEGVHTHPATNSSNYNYSNSDFINGTNQDSISHYTTYLTSLNFIAHYIATTYNNNTCNYNQLAPSLSSSCLPSFPFINHPTTTPALHDNTTAHDHKLRHLLLQLLMHHQDNIS